MPAKLSKFSKIKYLIPNECLVGPNDCVPGLVDSHIPKTFAGLEDKKNFNDKSNIYVHNIQLSSLSRIEKAFLDYLQKVCELKSEEGKTA